MARHSVSLNLSGKIRLRSNLKIKKVGSIANACNVKPSDRLTTPLLARSLCLNFDQFPFDYHCPSTKARTCPEPSCQFPKVDHRDRLPWYTRKKLGRRCMWRSVTSRWFGLISNVISRVSDERFWCFLKSGFVEPEDRDIGKGDRFSKISSIENCSPMPCSILPVGDWLECTMTYADSACDLIAASGMWLLTEAGDHRGIKVIPVVGLLLLRLFSTWASESTRCTDKLPASRTMIHSSREKKVLEVLSRNRHGQGWWGEIGQSVTRKPFVLKQSLRRGVGASWKTARKLPTKGSHTYQYTRTTYAHTHRDTRHTRTPKHAH
jgi:hypothetical protein